jgi:hypothetical protein
MQGELENPKSVAFIKQQNNAAGHQPVNYGTALPARAHGEKAVTSNELLEHRRGEWLDAGAAGEAGRGNQAVAALDNINGAANRER